MTGRIRTRGFTLVEVLVVMAILGILAAIALPEFAGRQAQGFNARVASDTRNAAAGQEAYYTDNFVYSSDCAALPGYVRSDGIVFTECAGDATRFRITADHPAATRRCTWDSAAQPTMACTPK